MYDYAKPIKSRSKERIRNRSRYSSYVDSVDFVSTLLFLFFLPFFTIPELEYLGLEGKFTVWNFEESVYLLKTQLLKESPAPFVYNERGTHLFCMVLMAVSAIHILLLLAFAYRAYRYQVKAVTLGKITYTFSLIPAILSLLFSFYVNTKINDALMVPNTFSNLTVFSKLVPSAMPYFFIFLFVVMMVGLQRFLDTKKEEYVFLGKLKAGSQNKMSKRTKVAVLIILLFIPVMIAFGIVFLKDRSYYFISLCIIFVSMVPFFMMFEDRKPQAREVILISVLVVIATAGRAAFFMLPQFKPVTAIVIIAGISLGAEAGFLTGAMTGLVSNFFFGQGPWTPWQMFAFGIIGFLAGLIFRGERASLSSKRYIVCTFGGFATLFIYGLIMDTSSALSFLSGLTWEVVLAKYISGFPMNCIHAFSTIVFLFFLERPMLKKIERVKLKYGMIKA